MKLKNGDWYMLANTMRPEDRNSDCKVVITGMDRKSVFYDQKAGPGMPATGSFMMSRADFRKYSRVVVV
ncbi:hypothetical protein HF670_02055 [Acidithiobacillus thiooxidans]|uniref:hypothetical protein n=1 Tax=Acidithiobacillus thiooxidans TaxID=930 RepID=UPI001C075AFE|nr:hypothetical protein [Acidithiobacillus thiooxidans]MBU2838369.1 hypothetical protein [Acidithiobacillus thiooxidans]